MKTKKPPKSGFVMWSTEVERPDTPVTYMRGHWSVSEVLNEFENAIKITHLTIYPPKLKIKSIRRVVWQDNPFESPGGPRDWNI